MLEPISFLSHLGAVTRKVSIGTSVVILPYRNPVVLAKAIATADVLSRGRVIFGAAIGWMEGEFHTLNAPFANRAQVSNEYLRLLKELWTNPRPAFGGEHFQVSEVTFSPMPVQQPHPPIWIGGRSRAGVRRAVEYGDFWHPSQMGPPEVAKNAEYMRQYSASVGRETPPQLSVQAPALSFASSSASEERPTMSGTIEDVIGDIQGCAEAGVSHIIMEISGDTFADKFRAMERFAGEVRPRVSQG